MSDRKKSNYSLFSLAENIKKTGFVVILGIFLFFISSTVTIITDIPILIKLFQDTILYKQVMEEKIERLQVGAQINLFIETLGSPMFVNTFDEDKLEYIFVNKYYYVDAITEKNGNVIQYAVTSRTSDFNPVLKSSIFDINGSHFNVILGRTKFHELPDVVNQIVGCAGTNYYFYYETYLLGNPTNYQNYAFGDNMSGYLPENFYKDKFQTLNKITDTNCLGLKKITETDTKNNLNLAPIQDWRNNATINTYLITAPFQEIITSNGIGVDYRQVRILHQ